MTDADRALRAFRDVLAVEWDADTGLARIVTLSGCYLAVPEEGQHLCPDREYHDVGLCKHLVALEATRGKLDVPTGWLVTEDLDTRPEGNATECDFMTGNELMTDGGEPGGNQPKGHDKFTVWDPERENARHFDGRGEADNAQEMMLREFNADTELFPPGESPEALYHGEPEPDTATDGGETAVVETPDDDPRDSEDTPDAEPAPDTNHEPEVLSPDEVEQYAADLDDRSVGQDPLNWMPGEFVDTIDGTEAINRKGFEVLRFFYGVTLDMTLEVDPEENDMTHCRYKCVAELDGDTFEAWGTSHVDRGDDPWLLVEMAATRARKRAISIATGAGAVAVAELQNEVGE